MQKYLTFTCMVVWRFPAVARPRCRKMVAEVFEALHLVTEKGSSIILFVNFQV